MLFKVLPKRNPFLDYITEDDDDEELPSNRKRITLKASDGRRTSYTKDAEINLDDATSDELTEDDTEFGDDLPDDTESEDMGGNAPNEPITDDTDFGDMGDGGEETNGNDNSGETPDEPITDDTDFSGDGENTENNSGSGENNEGENGNGDSSESKTEQILKYKLYQKFQDLDKLLKRHTEILSNMVCDDVNMNQKYKKIANNIKELNQVLSEYMILKFQTASYAQSRLCYQQVATGTDINLNALQDIKTEIAKNTED